MKKVSLILKDVCPFQSCVALLLGVLFSSQLFSQLPSDNPYTTKYGNTDHWTNAIKWNKVTDASAVKGLITADRRIDSATLSRTLKKISSAGGGVLYFPAGKYFINYNLHIENAVVLRGADPSVKNATDAAYRPPTIFEFPKYNPSYTGCGTPHSNFKSIYADTTGVQNAGIVNIDVNRATIHFFGGDIKINYTLLGDKQWPHRLHDNIIVFGVRQNNAVLPTSEVPTAIQIEKGNCWQRWPHPYIGNINLFVKHNGLVANCRLNDAVTDNFKQPGYVDNYHGEFDGDQATFSYVDHPGVCLNGYNVNTRGKLGKTSGPWGPYGVLPDMAHLPGFRDLDSAYNPCYYSSGEKKVVDNYIFTRRRHGKVVSFADKVIIKDNIFEDTGEALDYVDIKGIESSYISSPVSLVKKFQAGTYLSGSRPDTLRYLFRSPEKVDPARKYPLVLFLHPDDLSGYDNAKHLALFMPGFMARQRIPQYDSYILAPQETIVAGAWIDISTKILTRNSVLSIKLMNEIIEKTPTIDRNRVYIIGMAAGGIAAWHLAAQYPETFAASVALDGVEFAFTEHMHRGLTKYKTPVMAGAPRPYAYLTWFLNTRLSILKLKKAGNDAVFKWVQANDRNDMMYRLSEDNEFYTWLYKNSLENRQYSKARQ